MRDLLNDLNWVMRTKKMIPMAISIAFIRKSIVSAWSSCSPVREISIPLGILKPAMELLMIATTSLAVYPESTSEFNVITLFRFFRLIPP